MLRSKRPRALRFLGVKAIRWAFAAGPVLGLACGHATEDGDGASTPDESVRPEVTADAGVVPPPNGADASATDAGTDGSLRLAPGVNALVTPGASATDSPLPLYRVGTGNGSGGVAFQRRGDMLAALDANGRTVWEKPVGPGALFGGFDIDRDGWPDFGIVRASPNGETCGTVPTMDTSIDLGLGKTGELFTKVVPPLPDICWRFGATIYPTQQWTTLGVLFGASTDAVVLVPQYTSTTSAALVPYNEGKATVVALRNGALTKLGDIVMPSVPAFDAFAAARPEPHGSGSKHYVGTHVPNGLLAGSSSSPELRFFTSGRAVVYQAQAPFGLLYDYPYLSANRTDMVGRNYGLVAVDPADTTKTVLVAGTSAFSLDADMRSGTMGYDEWGGIERHVSVHDVSTNTLVDRFFSYAHDDADGRKYEGRVVYPDSPFLAPKQGGITPSRLLFNVYAGGRWRTTVTAPGGVTSARELLDVFVWDIRDLDGDGVAEIVASPARDASEPDVPGYYFVKWRTQIFHWDEATSALVLSRTFEGALPWLVPTFPTAARTSSQGALYPVLTVAVGERPAMVLRARDGTRRLETF
jgi:hypothetical protein